MRAFKQTNLNSCRSNGWTLIELMVVLAVIAILLAIAYPSFNEQIVKARRADGHALLVGAAQRQQQFYSVNMQFTDTIGSGGLDLSSSSTEGYYTLSVSLGGNPQTYVLTASRAGSQTSDTKCGDLTLTHQGVKGNVNGSWTSDRCW